MDRLDTVAAELTEAVGVFDRERDLERAVDALLGAGFDRADLSLLASAQAVTERLGYADWQVRRLEDDPRTPTVAYASGESRGDGEGAVLGVPMYVIGVTAAGLTAAAGGPLATAIAATALGMGTGAALGGVLAHLIGQRHVEHVENQLVHGGLLLWVRADAPGDDDRAVEILKANGARDVHVHTVSSAPGRADLAGGHSRLRQPVAGGQGLAPAAVGLRCPRTPGRRGRGHGDCQGDMLRRITEALMALGAEPDPERSAPTRQGGA